MVMRYYFHLTHPQRENYETNNEKNYETADLQFREITKIEKQNYETRKKAVTSTFLLFCSNVS